jgi:nucleoside-diphosphate-sugar epimerase
MKVLVTGLGGFTGAYLERELAQHGHAVTGLQADLTDWDAVAREVAAVQPEAVIHLAAISFVPSGDSTDVYAVNTLGTQGLLEALARLPAAPKKVILASSSNVYGMRAGVLDESMCPKPVNHYGCSKLAMEHIAETYTARLPIVITRPFNYTGVGQSDKFLIPKIVSHFKSRSPEIELGNTDVARDFSDVRWVASAYRVLMESSDLSGEVINLCSGNATSISTIITILEELSGHKVDIRVNPEFVRDNDIKMQSGDNGKIGDIMSGYVSCDIKSTLDWMLRS